MSAIISECGHYRYRLERTFDGAPESGVVAFIMVNPSTADAEQDDPTIRRCITFAKRQGARKLLVGNLFAFRATDVKELPWPGAIGPDNDKHLADICQAADIVIAAWGPTSKLRIPVLRTRWKYVVKLVGKPLHCLGTAKDGQPRHPLMLRADAPLELWSPV